jgi:CubicO group peptidase (beta-lactamase class C family)
VTTPDGSLLARLGALVSGPVRTVPGSAISISARIGDGDAVTLLRGTASTDDPAELTADALFDLASLSKVFVAVAALSFVDDGLIDLDEPVRRRLSVGSGPGAETITLRHLLGHLSGLPASSLRWREQTDAAALLDEALASPLTAPPGRRHEYSCLGYIATGRLLEELSGLTLDRIVECRVLRPLGARTASYGPVRPERAVATELQPGRGMLRGAIHDELAHTLARPVGNAGLFCAADDVLALGEMVLGAGVGRNGRVLSEQTVKLMTTPMDSAEENRPAYRQALGLRHTDASFMGAVGAVGHTGFTGTSLVIDPERRTVAVLLTNRVHPTRENSDISWLRSAVAEAVAGRA